MPKKKKKGILEHFGFTPANYAYDDAEDEDNTVKTVSQDDLVALRGEISKLQEAVERNNREALLLSASTYRQPEQQQQQQYKEPEFTIDHENLPDPVTEPEAYAKELTQRNQKALQEYNRVAQQNEKARHSQSNRIDTLWENFNNTYENYAADPRRVEFAALQVANQLQNRGVDVERYMFNQQDLFFKDVVKQMDEIFAAPKTDKTIDDDETEEDNEPENRTSGVFGGLETGGRPARHQDNDPGDMIKDIHNLQKKSGFF